MVKTYILAPDYSTPPPPNGPIRLGSVLCDLQDLAPLNPEHHIDIPESKVFLDIKEGFEATRSSLLDGNLGIWAQFCAMFGVGIEAGWAVATSHDDVISFEKVETSTFNPTPEYIQQVMAIGSVKAFMRAGNNKLSVYVITGLKVGKGASLKSSKSQEHNVKLKLALDPLGTAPKAGPDVGLKTKKEEKISFTGSSDFVIAFRVRRIRYKDTILEVAPYNTGATMLDSTENGKDGDLVLLDEGDAQLDDMELDPNFHFKVLLEVGADGEESSWIMPDIPLE
ncbi:hypothetical protein F4806DRAFT_482809 [Annulohypoxylon nitens]|nr:hypothetical protein F4806DRAFT_482809 [Annulohypoxylon nitens]